MADTSQATKRLLMPLEVYRPALYSQQAFRQLFVLVRWQVLSI